MLLKCVWCWTCSWSDVSGKWHWIATMLWFWGCENHLYVDENITQWWLSGKESDCQSKMCVRSLRQEDSLEMEMTTHCTIPACKIPRIEEPGRLQPMGITRVGYDLLIEQTSNFRTTTTDNWYVYQYHSQGMCVGAGEGCHWWFTLSSELSNV